MTTTKTITKEVPQSCSNCHCWQLKPVSKDVNGNSSPVAGFCQINPPIRVEAGIASFPSTSPSTWCFQWQAIKPRMTTIEVIPDDAPLPIVPPKAKPTAPAASN